MAEVTKEEIQAVLAPEPEQQPKPAEKVVEKVVEKPVLPKEFHELPSKVDQLAKALLELRSTVQQLLPEPKEPCPTCGTLLPKEQAEKARQNLPVREVIKEVPVEKIKEVPKEVVKEVVKEVPKEVPKPEISMDLFKQTLHSVFPEKPEDKIAEAFKKFAEAARKFGWLK
jgi:DNA repair exonuclease SbcCD ATPase subunit